MDRRNGEATREENNEFHLGLENLRCLWDTQGAMALELRRKSGVVTAAWKWLKWPVKGQAMETKPSKKVISRKVEVRRFFSARDILSSCMLFSTT